MAWSSSTQRARRDDVDLGARASPGSIHAALSSSARARLARATSVTTSAAPAAASSRARRPPTWPSPIPHGATPSRSPEDALAGRRGSSISTPSAVHGLGSPEPPRSRGSPATWLGQLGDHRHVGVGRADVLRGHVAAVGGATVSPKSSSASRPRRRRGRLAGRRHDHALAAARRQAGDRGLVGHPRGRRIASRPPRASQRSSTSGSRRGTGRARSSGRRPSCRGRSAAAPHRTPRGRGSRDSRSRRRD